MSNQEAKAISYIEQAESTLNKKSFFSSLLGSGSQKYEDAAELFTKAANIYKVARNMKAAGDTFMRAAVMHEKSNSSFEAGRAYVDAGKCFKEIDIDSAVIAMRHALSHFTEMGRFTQAAKMLQELGDIHESQQNYEDARDAYTTAADYFRTENSTSTANQCLLKVASIISKYLEPPDYIGAAKIYEEIGRSCASVPLLKMSAKGHFLNAALCLMASNDTVATRMKIEEFKAIDYTFEKSRDCQFAEDLCEAMENFDKETVASISYEYDQVTTLDAWKTSILLAIKRRIEAEVGDDMGDEEVDLT